MNPETPKSPREELEARVTALLLGELSADEAAAVREAIAQDAELRQLHDRLKQAVELVRETVTTPAGEPMASPTPLRLSPERREKLLERFKTVKPRQFEAPRRRWEMPWFVPMSAAAVLVGLVGASMLLPEFRSRKDPMRLTAIPGQVQLGLEVSSPKNFDTERAAAGESRDRTLWMRQSLQPAAPAAPAATPPPAPPTDLPAAPPVPSEPKISKYAIALPDSAPAGGPVDAVTLYGRAVNQATPVVVAGRSDANADGARKTFGGYGGFGGGGAFGGGQAGGQTMLWDESRDLARTERFAQAGEPVAKVRPVEAAPSAVGRSAPVFQRANELAPAGPGGNSLDDAFRMKGAAVVAGTGKTTPSSILATPPMAPPPANEPMPALRLAERGEAARERLAEAPAQASPAATTSPAFAAAEGIATTASDRKEVADLAKGEAMRQVTDLERKDRLALESKPTEGEPKLEASLEPRQSEKKLSVTRTEVSDRNGPIAIGALESLGTAAGAGITPARRSSTVDPATGLPVVAEPAQGEGQAAAAKRDGLVAGDDFSAQPTEPNRPAVSGRPMLGDTPMLGRFFKLAGGDSVGGIPAPTSPAPAAKPASAPEKDTKENAASFGLTMVNGEAPVKLQSIDASGSQATAQSHFFADSSALASGAVGAKDTLRRSEEDSLSRLYFDQGDATGGRAGAETQARGIGQVAGEWDFSGFDDRYDLDGAVVDNRSGASAGKQVQAGLSKDRSFRAAGAGPVTVTGYTNRVIGFDSGAAISGQTGLGAAANFATADESKSKLAAAEGEEESLLRRRVEIALPATEAEEGRPVGERSAGHLVVADLTRGKADGKPVDAPAIQAAGQVSRGRQLAELEEQRRQLAARMIQEGVDKALPGQAAVEEKAAKEIEANLAAIDERIHSLGQEQTKAVAEDTVTRRPPPNAPIPQPEVQTADNAFSTFSLNVSDVSFKLAAASLEQGKMPDASTVRSEEFINAFDYRDPEPPPGMPIAFAWERARYPFAHHRDLLRFSVKTAAAGRQPGRFLNLVLLLDNSGSMERADRVRIIHECLRVLAGQLQTQDRISVVTFARTPRLWVDGLAGSQAAQMAEDVSRLTPQGGTNLEEAMNLAYQTALRHYIANGINRVVLLTDGAANLGEVDPENLKQKVESFRKQGIALDCFGIGWEGYNDDLLEVLSRNGDGRYGFVNTPEAAATEFAGQLAGALQVAASDVKVQIEFNPKRVTAYRQIGYAKHQLTKEQFRDNTVDAAEIGAAEAGNALYVVEVNPRGDGPLAIARVRFKVPGTADYREHEWVVPFTGPAVPLEQASPAMRLAATASAFSEWLVASPLAGDVTPEALLGYLHGVPEVFGADARPKKLEWMIRQAKSITGR